MTLQLDNCTYAKSTLLRLAAGVTQPKTGSVTYGSILSSRREYRRAVAWMPQDIVAMSGLTAREQVAYAGWLKGMSTRAAWDGALEALARVDLRDQASKKAKHLSGGQLRRVGVASALVHGSRILLLDEPTAGMDPQQRGLFRELLAILTPRMQVLLSTHDVADLADEADHVTVLDQGRIVFTGHTGDFLQHAPEGTAPGRAAEAAYAAISMTGARL
ncbi:ATP-binding cassette domain-containing protein [Streptomyces xiaopingdaonensis]|uniref:ATP-binding cassette domain-containing protein n=1 Tax=Streptomyces xiaopingdaonensis TaxID=1565415 RepID=UPI00037FC3C5|nr:ATP-binding cassette domain-containing protein [Streptomyces xiaopingdaonensis]